GETYEFSQLEASNWYHPLGFAYYPDGAHEGVDELEEGIGSGERCQKGGGGGRHIFSKHLGSMERWSLGNMLLSCDCHAEALSDLDTYEPQFFFPEETWLETNYTVELTVTDPDVTEIFYFCHIHNGMSGR
ncbi:unnamed protein product, partial [Ectocarpus sp. 12 AP-2014]